MGCLKGLAGSVRGLQCHPSKPLLASCGLDRVLRIHRIRAPRGLEHKVGSRFLPARPSGAVDTGVKPPSLAGLPQVSAKLPPPVGPGGLGGEFPLHTLSPNSHFLRLKLISTSVVQASPGCSGPIPGLYPGLTPGSVQGLSMLKQGHLLQRGGCWPCTWPS